MTHFDVLKLRQYLYKNSYSKYYNKTMIFANFFKTNQGRKILSFSSNTNSKIIKNNLSNQSLLNNMLNKNMQAFVLQKKSISFLNLNYRSVYHFAVPKSKNTIKVQVPQQKKQEKKQIKKYPVNQVGWKLSTFVNLVSIPAFFLFPSLHVASTVIVMNTLIMAIAQSDRFQIMITKFDQQFPILSTKKKQASKKAEQKQQILSQNQIFTSKLELGKKTYLQFLRSALIFAFMSVVTMYGPYYPQMLEAGLIGLNFWVLYNIKFNNFSQGYYYTLISSLIVLAIYFYLKTQSQKQKEPSKESKEKQAIKTNTQNQKTIKN